MAASRYEVEVTVASARDLKNVNWRNGDLKPYAVVWIDDGAKCSTRVDLDNADNPTWDDKLTVPLPPSTRLDDAVLYLDVVHANATDGVKPLVGSARLPLRDVLADTGIGARASRSLRLKRPSGRPHGRLEVRVAVREPKRYYDPSPAYPAPYHQQSSRDPYAYGNTTTGGYGYAYGGAPPAPYGAPPVDAKKKSKMGMGGGLAVGAAAGVLGGLALAGGASYLENKFEDRVAERVEEDRYGGGGGGYDDYGDDDY
uniref:C2 domain-containing protein n=1 Tax=Oryza rufipogon TaxID=4529 RepID=A0A0E0QVD9_ORYRU